MVNDSKKRDPRFHVRHARSGALGDIGTAEIPGGSKNRTHYEFVVYGVKFRVIVSWRTNECSPERDELFFPGIKFVIRSKTSRQLGLRISCGPETERQNEKAVHVERVLYNAGHVKRLMVSREQVDFDFTKPFWVRLRQNSSEE